ncbi:DNA-methyltransferase [Burkholderia gladioli]|uniref:DNA-methyltransferase n=1 Tax=Burkholderia gladioli TaxID=28095 RepID=UPI00163E5C8C|nr:site-specific DNA-methyltransferase [Burkholderia gladioli]
MLLTKNLRRAWESVSEGRHEAAVRLGDSMELARAIPDGVINLTVTSPPYCMGKEYEGNNEVESFVEAHLAMLPEIVRATADGGSICWQVGNYVRKNEVLPLDYLVYDIMRQIPGVKLRNRIVWTFGHGLHCQSRFSGRHETILWFTKGDDYEFDLDSVRIPQRYPGKRSAKGPNKGEYSGNPRGKNPSDVWDIPNVKANHIEKTEHPCQYPVALVQRLVKALCPVNGILFDPYCGVGSAGVAAVLEGRRFIGGEIWERYATIAEQRINEAVAGIARVRPLDLPVYEPRPTERVAQRPDHFWQNLTIDLG